MSLVLKTSTGTFFPAALIFAGRKQLVRLRKVKGVEREREKKAQDYSDI